MDKSKQILETLKLQPLSDEEKASRHILGRLYGPIATCEESTRNGRKYNRELWQKALADEIFNEKVANKSLFLELGHPANREETDMEKVCACIPCVPTIVDGDLYAYVDILDTPNGRLLKTLCDYGFIPGISSRGSGDIMANDEVDPETFFLETWDIVQLPAVKKARLSMMHESFDGKKTLKTALQESYNAADEEGKKVMKESLENLEFNIDFPDPVPETYSTVTSLNEAADDKKEFELFGGVRKAFYGDSEKLNKELDAEKAKEDTEKKVEEAVKEPKEEEKEESAKDSKLAGFFDNARKAFYGDSEKLNKELDAEKAKEDAKEVGAEDLNEGKYKDQKAFEKSSTAADIQMAGDLEFRKQQAAAANAAHNQAVLKKLELDAAKAEADAQRAHEERMLQLKAQQDRRNELAKAAALPGYKVEGLVTEEAEEKKDGIGDKVRKLFYGDPEKIKAAQAETNKEEEPVDDKVEEGFGDKVRKVFYGDPKLETNPDNIPWGAEDPEESKQLHEDSDEDEMIEISAEEIPAEEIDTTEETVTDMPVEQVINTVEEVADKIKEIVNADEETAKAIDEVVEEKKEELLPEEDEQTEVEETPVDDIEAESTEETTDEEEKSSEEAEDSGLNE